MYRLTEEGEKYLEKGLPEKRLMLLLDKPEKINQLQGMEDFNIALQWAKKNRWIRIEKGVVVPLSRPGSPPQEKALKQIAEGHEIDYRLLLVLIRRKLVREEREDTLKRAEQQLKKGVTTPTPELIKTGMWKKVAFKPYNVTVTGKKIYLGKRHPYNAFLTGVRRRLVGLGFKEMTGPLIETEFWNFDALFQPQDHPSRDWTQTYSLLYPSEGSLPHRNVVTNVKKAHEGRWKGSKGWGYRWNPKKASRLMPRAHGTALSARILAALPEIPGKYFAIVRCFRPDVIDATHGVEFNHVEGIVIDSSLTFRHLLGILKLFAKEFAGTEKIKFMPDYYPFTEASCQLSVKHPELGWMEIAGAGIFREELTGPLGVTEPVIAWGIGIDRLAMITLGITDIRQLFSRDLEWLRKSKVV